MPPIFNSDRRCPGRSYRINFVDSGEDAQIQRNIFEFNATGKRNGISSSKRTTGGFRAKPPA